MFGFWVGGPTAVHRNPFGARCEKALRKKLDLALSADEREPYCSADCAWNGLKQLHGSLATVVGEERAKVIEYSEAFVPVEIGHTKLKLNLFGTEFLRVSSLRNLVDDLDSVARERDWPSSKEGKSIQDLRKKEELFDENPELHTYCEFVAAAKEAVERDEPLWIS